MANGLKITKEQLMRKRSRKACNYTANTIANLEPGISDASMGAQKAQGCHTPCSITIHSIRKRLADADGISAKAAIDGIVHAGLLPDDKAEFVQEVRYSQRKAKKGEEEITTITMETVNQSQPTKVKL